MQVAEGIERIHERYINFFLVEEAGRVVVVDSGMPGNWGLLLAGLGRIGRTLGDVEAVLLTHAHSDHVGLAERLRREAPAPVRIHTDDLPYLLAGRRPAGTGPPGGDPHPPGRPRLRATQGRSPAPARRRGDGLRRW